MTGDPDELVAVDLPDDGRELLIQGLAQWGGPARSTDVLARVMGFADRDAVLREGDRIRSALAEERPMAAGDWRRALVATEVVFASEVHGAGLEWEIATGWTDADTLALLRNVQLTLADALASVGPPS